MKEVSKARLICGIFAILLICYELFVFLPDLMSVASQYGIAEVSYKTILHLILRLGFYLGIATWSLSGVLEIQTEA